MGKNICSISMILFFLILGVGTANSSTTRYVFEGVFTTGELDGYGFSGWFDYDKTEFGTYQQTNWVMSMPSISWENETGAIIVGNYHERDIPNTRQDSYEDHYHVSGWVPGPAGGSVNWGLNIEWTPAITDPSELIPTSSITNSLFRYSKHDYFAWYTLDPYKDMEELAIFDGQLTCLKAVPVPSAIWLLGSGIIGIMGLRKKYKK